MINLLTATLICVGTAPTHPVTNVEIKIRPEKFSTIRYEIAEGSLTGTSYVQSIGYMTPKSEGSMTTFRSGDSELETILTVTTMDNHIHESRFSHHITGMKDSIVKCEIQEDSEGHSGH